MAGKVFENWFHPIETEVRARAREFIEELIHGELDAALARLRYGRVGRSAMKAKRMFQVIVTAAGRCR